MVIRSATLLVAVLAATLITPGGAHAGPPRILDYWTPDRMAAATSPDTGEVALGVRAELTRAPRPYTAPGVRVHGKVFWSKGGRDSWCSASVATAPNKSMVWSAAHCLAGTSNVMFVPAYNSAGTGDAPYGRWPARKVATSGNDHALALVTQVGGRSLEDVVGANGIRFTGPIGGRTTVWGYPAARIWTGRDLTYCNQPVQVSGSSARIACDTEGGSSGGGYITGASTPTGPGQLWANHSAGAGATAIGVVFGNAAQQLYRANMN